MVTHQLQVECRTGKVRQSETDVLPLCHANRVYTKRRTTVRWVVSLHAAGAAVPSSRRWAALVGHPAPAVGGRVQWPTDRPASPEHDRDQLQGVRHDAAADRHARRLLAAIHDIPTALGARPARTVSPRTIFCRGFCECFFLNLIKHVLCFYSSMFLYFSWTFISINQFNQSIKSKRTKRPLTSQ